MQLMRVVPAVQCAVRAAPALYVAATAQSTAAATARATARQHQLARHLQLQHRGLHTSSTTLFDITKPKTWDGNGNGNGRRKPSNNDKWPITKINLGLNVCPQGKVMIIERLGKFDSIQTGGLFLAIPLIDSVAYVVDMRERTILVDPQSCISKDNVSIEVSGNMFVQFVEPKMAAYGSLNPLYNVEQFAQSAMRNAIGSMDFDRILQARQELNNEVKAALDLAARPWGIKILRYEITEVMPDRGVQIAMDKQAVAERDRREQVLQAEGTKRSLVLESEGVKIRKQNESEGELIKVRNEALAEKEKLVLEAEGQATAMLATAQATAESIDMIAGSLAKPGGQNAAQYDIAQKYVEAFGELAQESNTLMLPTNAGDPAAMVAQAMAIYNHTARE